MWFSVSITVKPLGFGGAVKDRRIIVFVKKLRNKDQEPHRQKLVREMTTDTEGKKRVECASVYMFMCTHLSLHIRVIICVSVCAHHI